MIKRYCDCCGNEITKTNEVHCVFRASAITGETRKRFGSAKIYVEVVTTKSAATGDDGDFCKYCIIDAINTADDRPKASKGST